MKKFWKKSIPDFKIRKNPEITNNAIRNLKSGQRYFWKKKKIGHARNP